MHPMDPTAVLLMLILIAGVVVASFSARVLTMMRPRYPSMEAGADPLLTMGVLNAVMFAVWIFAVFKLAGAGVACLAAAGGLVLLVPSDLPVLANRLVQRFGVSGFGRLSLALEVVVLLSAIGVYAVVRGGAGF